MAIVHARGSPGSIEVVVFPGLSETDAPVAAGRRDPAHRPGRVDHKGEEVSLALADLVADWDDASAAVPKPIARDVSAGDRSGRKGVVPAGRRSCRRTRCRRPRRGGRGVVRVEAARTATAVRLTADATTRSVARPTTSAPIASGGARPDLFSRRGCEPGSQSIGAEETRNRDPDEARARIVGDRNGDRPGFRRDPARSCTSARPRNRRP
jgi:hypothetical protein